MFYESIAKVYDFIFPKNEMQLNLINTIKKIEHHEQILDIGCATGNLTELLHTKTSHVIGLDLDAELLSIAKEKSRNKINYQEMNMLDLGKHFEESSLDRIVSFGNTLVHLPNRSDVKKFFASVYRVLKTEGVFTFQIINYDRIIDQSISCLPTIDNDHILFLRDYVYHIEQGYVDFNTSLTIKSNQQKIENSIPLLALRSSEIQKLLTASGFKNIQLIGNLQGDVLNENSIPLIVSCVK